MTPQEYSYLFFNVYIMVLVMYTIYFLLRIFAESFAKQVFVGATMLLITNSVLSLLYFVRNKSIADIVFSSVMLCVGLLLAYYYIAYLMNKPKPVAKVRKGLRYITTAEEWVDKNMYNRNFEKQLEKRLRSDKRFGEDWVYEQGSRISPQELKQKINEMRVSKLRQQRTLDKKIEDLKTIAQLREKPARQRTRELNNLLLENPTFAQQVVQAVKNKIPQTFSETMVDQNKQNQETLKTILQEPILEQPLNKMLSVFGQSTKSDQQSQIQFFEKLQSDLAKTRETSIKQGKPFRSDQFNNKFLSNIEGKDPSIWLRKTAKLENMTDKQLLNVYTSKILSDMRTEQRARARKIASSNRRRRR